MAADKVVWEWRNFKPHGDTRVVIAEFFTGQYAVISRQMHSWLGLRSDQIERRNDMVMVPGDLVLGQYCHSVADLSKEGEVCWDTEAKCLKNDGRPRQVSLLADSKVLSLGRRKITLPVATYVGRTPAGYNNSDLYGSGWVGGEMPATMLFIPLEATVKALGGRVYRLYGNGPLLISFPPAKP